MRDLPDARKWRIGGHTAEDCPMAPHRLPEGPNEDVAQCGWCMSPMHVMRKWGETFGNHIPDCSLPIWHESYCKPGGEGHPVAPTVRG